MLQPIGGARPIALTDGQRFNWFPWDLEHRPNTGSSSKPEGQPQGLSRRKKMGISQFFHTWTEYACHREQPSWEIQLCIAVMACRMGKRTSLKLSLHAQRYVGDTLSWLWLYDGWDLWLRVLGNLVVPDLDWWVVFSTVPEDQEDL